MSVIAMDFGTYNSAVAYRLPNGEVELFRPPGALSPIIPSFLKFSPNGDLECFGEPAKNALETDPKLVVWGVKRLLGRSYNDARGELERFQYDVLSSGEEGKLKIKAGPNLFTPIDLVALFLREVKKAVESPAANLPLDGPVDTLILTHPAYFDSAQITCLKEAAEQAGFPTVELVREPEAAAMAYMELIDYSRRPLVMVIDWGAGTLDFYIAYFFFENGRPLIVPGTAAFGDTHLGGIDMDDALVSRFKQIHRLDRLDWRDEARLRVEIERMKIALSEPGVGFTTRFFAAGQRPIVLNLAQSANDVPPEGGAAQWICLEEALAGILDKFKQNLRYILREHHFSPGDIEYLILVGGPMLMPVVWAAIREVFAENRQIVEQLSRFEQGFPVSPFEAVVKGAILRQQAKLGAVQSAYTYGFLTDQGLLPGLLIPRGTPLARDSRSIRLETKPLGIRPGQFVKVSLYMKEETAHGPKHWQVGEYTFAPVAATGRGTQFQAAIEFTEEEICWLEVRDLVSGQVLRLPFKEDDRRPIDEPQFVEIFGIDDLPDQVRSALVQAFQSGEFSQQLVEEHWREANTYLAALNQAAREGRQLPGGVLDLCQQLTRLLPQVPRGRAIRADSSEARLFQNMLISKEQLKKILRNCGFQF